jgi:hypothetical protein
MKHFAIPENNDVISYYNILLNMVKELLGCKPFQNNEKNISLINGKFFSASRLGRRPNLKPIRFVTKH